MTRVRIGQGWELSRRQINALLPSVGPVFPVSTEDTPLIAGRYHVLTVPDGLNAANTGYVYDGTNWVSVKGGV